MAPSRTTRMSLAVAAAAEADAAAIVPALDQTMSMAEGCISYHSFAMMGRRSRRERESVRRITLKTLTVLLWRCCRNSLSGLVERSLAETKEAAAMNLFNDGGSHSLKYVRKLCLMFGLFLTSAKKKSTKERRSSHSHSIFFGASSF